MHVVLPRRKAGELDTPEREAVVVTPEVLASLFQHPLAVASQKLVGPLSLFPAPANDAAKKNPLASSFDACLVPGISSLRYMHTSTTLLRRFSHLLPVSPQGLSATTIKKLCRKLGINKWPYKSPFRTARSGCSAAAPASGPSNNRGGKRSRQESNADEDSDRTPSPVESALASPSSSCEASGPTEPAEEGEGRRTDIALLLAEATTSLVAHGGSSKRSRN